MYINEGTVINGYIPCRRVIPWLSIVRFLTLFICKVGVNSFANVISAVVAGCPAFPVMLTVRALLCILEVYIGNGDIIASADIDKVISTILYSQVLDSYVISVSEYESR